MFISDHPVHSLLINTQHMPFYFIFYISCVLCRRYWIWPPAHITRKAFTMKHFELPFCHLIFGEADLTVVGRCRRFLLQQATFTVKAQESIKCLFSVSSFSVCQLVTRSISLHTKASATTTHWNKMSKLIPLLSGFRSTYHRKTLVLFLFILWNFLFCLWIALSNLFLNTCIRALWDPKKSLFPWTLGNVLPSCHSTSQQIYSLAWKHMERGLSWKRPLCSSPVFSIPFSKIHCFLPPARVRLHFNAGGGSKLLLSLLSLRQRCNHFGPAIQKF